MAVESREGHLGDANGAQRAAIDRGPTAAARNDLPTCGQSAWASLVVTPSLGIYVMCFSSAALPSPNFPPKRGSPKTHPKWGYRPGLSPTYQSAPSMRS